jgi:hypothetical protein
MAEMGFTPPVFPAAEGGLMPQSPQEAADLQQQGQGAVNMATTAIPFALGGPMARATGWGAARVLDLARRFPEVFAGAGAMGGAATIMDQLEPTSAGAQRAPQPTDAVRALQRRLQEEGLYSGPIDGLMGQQTKDAAAKLEEIDARRSKQRERDQALELERARNETERARIQQQQQETERLRLEGQQADELVRQGSERLKAMKPGPLESWWAPWLARGLGLAEGYLGRGVTGHFISRERREISRRAGELAKGMGQGDVPERVGRLNEFWTMGNQRSAPPFSFQSARQPFPWATNANAVPPNQLFGRPSGLSGAIQNYGPAAVGGIMPSAELAVSWPWMNSAHAEQEAAQAAVNAPRGATPANVDRLGNAREDLAQSEFMNRMGLMGLGGVALGELEDRVKQSRLRPPIMAADAERGRLDAILNPTNPPPQPLQRIPKGQPGAGRFLPRGR